MLRNVSTTGLGTACDLPVECKVFYRYERRFKCTYALRLNHSCVTFNYFTCPAINHSISRKKNKLNRGMEDLTYRNIK